MSVTKEQAFERHDDVEWIKHPEWWANTLLPLKRFGHNHAMPNLAVLIAPFNVYVGANMWNFDTDNGELRVYESAEAIVADGWRVD